MKFNARWIQAALLGTLPLSITPMANDSTSTNVHLVGSLGQYADISRGCEGNVISKDSIPLRELGAAIDHRGSSSTRLGLNASYLFTEDEIDRFDPAIGYHMWELATSEVFALNPYLMLESPKVGLGGGILWSNRSLPDGDTDKRIYPSFYLRVGKLDKIYFDLSAFHGLPLITEGYAKIGLGSRRNPRFEWWLGTGAGPYDKLGLIGKSYVQLQPALHLNLFARLGSSEGVLESAAGVGLRYRF